jgi:ABC-type transporter Mla subunit MlaD
MNQLLAAIVASVFAFGSAAGYAADAPAKKEDLTKEERADLRARAEKLTTARAQGLPEHHVIDQTAPRKPAKKGTTPAPAVKKGEPKA